VNGFSKTVNSVVTYPPDLEFEYDAMGQRVLKIVKTRDAAGLKPQADWKYTYYVRDAAGNVLTTYNRTITVDQTNAAYRIDKYKVEEWTMYGSSRLGIQKPSGEGVTATELKFEPEQNNTYTAISRTATTIPTTSLLRKAGEKIYELSNHLGNVLVTVSDRVLPVVNPNAVAQTLYYSADVKSASDYSAFGAPLAGRLHNNDFYCYQYQSSEADVEISGHNSHFTTYYRELDTRIARWWSIDPKFSPFESPYVSMGNNPIRNNDVLGDVFDDKSKEAIAKHKESTQQKLDKAKGDLSKLTEEQVEERKLLEFQINEFTNALNEIRELEESNQVYTLVKINNDPKSKIKGATQYNSETKAVELRYISEAGLAHELTHAYQFEKGKLSFQGSSKNKLWDGGLIYSINSEVEAYQRQYAYYSGDFNVKYDKINGDWVKNNFGDMYKGLPEGTVNSNIIINELELKLGQAIGVDRVIFILNEELREMFLNKSVYEYYQIGNKYFEKSGNLNQMQIMKPSN
jgi:hypothetical protein